jgi:hypothetical protein
MRTTASILYGIASQTLSHRVLAGRPTSATFKVFNDYAGDDDTTEFSGSASVSAVSTTVSSASGPSQADPTKISLTATTSVTTSEKYLIAEGSRYEWVQPVEIVSGSYIRVRYPLKNDYTTAATFVGTTLSAAVDDTWAADLGNVSDQLDPNPGYRVRWAILVGGVTTVEYSYFDLVRAAVSHSVDVDDLSIRAPGYFDSIPTDYRVEQGRPIIEAAWQAVQAKLAAMSIDTDALRDSQLLDELVLLKSLCMIARGGWAPGAFSLPDYIKVTQDDFDRFIEQHLQVARPHTLAEGTSGAAENVPVKSYWSK